VFRNEKPGPGRFRQFMQFDADTVGTSSVAADAELCMMAADTLERLGVKRGDYVIKVNNRKVLDGVLEAIGLGGAENAGRRLTVLRAMDKFDKFGDEIRFLLGEGRKDESGDFTKGAHLDAEQQHEIMTLLRSQAQLVEKSTLPETIRADSAVEADASDLAFSNNETIRIFRGHFGGDPRIDEGLDELQAIADISAASGFSTNRIRIDPSVVRGLEYYTGPVFEAELTREVPGEDGRPVRFGSVGGGGRYDGLVGRFRGEDVPATGFSIGVSRLYAALKAINSPIVAGAAQRGPVIVLVLDQAEIARYQGFVSTLRNGGIAAELYLGSSGMNAQLKYADKRNAVCAIIQGSNEREKGEIAIRDLVLGAELAASSKERADYLELRTKAQFSVPEGDLLKAVREVFARHP
jgi:histidyl-tRNA synthetase